MGTHRTAKIAAVGMGGVFVASHMHHFGHDVGRSAWIVGEIATVAIRHLHEGWIGLVAIAAVWFVIRHRRRIARRMHGAVMSRIPARRPANIDEVCNLSPAGFEQFVVGLMQDAGYSQVRRCGGSGDLSVDVEALDEYGRKVIAQCKRYHPGHQVGSPEIQQFIGMAYTHHCVVPGNALYFTTASYSRPATALAAQHDIQLIDGFNLAQLINRHRGSMAVAA